SNRNRTGTNRSAAIDVRRRVADDDDGIALDMESELVECTALCDRRQLASHFVIGPEGGHSESRGIDADGAQLRVRPNFDIAREEPDPTIAASLQRVEQFQHAAEPLDVC